MDVLDQETHTTLYREVERAGWKVWGWTEPEPEVGVFLQRGPYTSYVPGIEKRFTSGKDWNDAVRRFLTQLQEEAKVRADLSGARFF